jgi:hypothetical protein
VVTIAALGDANRAMDLAIRIDDPTNRTCAKANLARFLATTGKTDQADKILASMTTTDVRERGILALIRAVAALAGVVTGDRATKLIERAITLADSISEPNYQARALTEIALAAPDQARRLVARALRVTADWTIPLAALAKVDRDVVIEIADELLAVRRTR